MKREFQRPTSLTLLLSGILLLLILLWLTVSIVVHGTPPDPHLARAASDLASQVGAARPVHAAGPLLSVAAVDTQISCTLETTTTNTTDRTWDNRSFETAITLANYTDLALVSGDRGETVPTHEDFYRLDNADVGARYTVQAKPDYTINYNLGIIVYDRERTPIITDTDTSTYPATVTFTPENVGPYYFKIFQVSEQCSGRTYSLIFNTSQPTATPSPTPTQTSTAVPTAGPTPRPTWLIGFDQYEPNFTFDVATTIAPGVTYDMNFIPWGDASVDNDFFKIRVKPGLQLTCETSDLGPGVDPRMAFYSGPGEQYFIDANDDIQLGNFNSRISYYATYEGWLYVLVGQGERMNLRDTINSDYSLTCQLTVPTLTTVTPMTPVAPPADKEPLPTPRPTATRRPTPVTSPLATPTEPPEGTVAPTPTIETEARVDVELTFRLVSSPEPSTPTPEPNGFRTFRVLIYYDENMDGEMGAGEGITGFFVLVLTPDGNEELAQGYTDEQGQISFTVPTVSTVRVLVPLLGYDRLIAASRPEVRVRIMPPVLPEAIP